MLYLVGPKVFIREIQEISDREKEEGREKEIERCYIASFKDGGKGPQTKDYRSPITLKAGKVKDTDFKSLQKKPTLTTL